MVTEAGAKTQQKNKQCTLQMRKQTSDSKLPRLPQPPKRRTSLNWRKKINVSITACDNMQPASPPVTMENSPSLSTRLLRDNEFQRDIESKRADISGRQKILFPRKLSYRTMLRKSTEANECRIAVTRLSLIENMTIPNKSSSPALSLEQLPKGANGVPIIVEACLRYFAKNATDCVGLFLAPGNESRVKKMWDYMQNHPCARLSINCVNVFMRKHKDFTANDVAHFLKLLIKSIVGTQSVITYNCYAPLVDLINSNCPSHKMGEKCRRIIGQLLVPEHRLLLGRLCNFLRGFCQHEAKTKMNCAKLAWSFKHLIQTPQEDCDNPSPRCSIPHAQSECKSNSKYKKRKSSRLSAEQTNDLVEKGETIKLCVSVIETLIKHSEHVFLQCLSPKCCTPFE